MEKYKLALAAVVLAGATACGANDLPEVAASPAASTGSTSPTVVLRGVVHWAPTSPAERPGRPATLPAAGTKVAAELDGEVVQTARTRGDGTFTMNLPAGTYQLRAGSETSPGRQAEAVVVHLVDAPVRVRLTLDTGIR